jgi:hypothetical protein
MAANSGRGRGAKTGPKPKPKAQKQARRMMLYLTEAEHRELQRAAGNEPLATYVRRLLVRHLARRRK